MLVRLFHLCLVFFTTYLVVICVSQLIAFLSNQGLLSSYGEQDPCTGGKKAWKDWTEAQEIRHLLNRLLINGMLLSLFVIQHSFMTKNLWKRLLRHFRICICERVIYVIFTCVTLSIVMNSWISTPDATVWSFDTNNSMMPWLFFFLLHAFAWSVLFLEIVCMDPLELIGLKQIYNYYSGDRQPLCYKPKDLQRFYQHMRHGGPFTLWLVLWVHPIMTLDRVLLAALLSLYTAFAYHVSTEDYLFARTHFAVHETRTQYYVKR